MSEAERKLLIEMGNAVHALLSRLAWDENLEAAKRMAEDLSDCISAVQGQS